MEKSLGNRLLEFYEKEWAPQTTQSLAETIGISIATLYAFFNYPDKGVNRPTKWKIEKFLNEYRKDK